MLKAGHIPRKYFIWPFLPPYMEVIPNQKMAFIFPILCILVLPFPFFLYIFPNVMEKIRSQHLKENHCLVTPGWG